MSSSFLVLLNLQHHSLHPQALNASISLFICTLRFLTPVFPLHLSSPLLFQSLCRVVCMWELHSSLLIQPAKPRAQSLSSFHPAPNHISAHNKLKPTRPLTLTLIKQPQLPFLLLVFFSHRKGQRKFCDSCRFFLAVSSCLEPVSFAHNPSSQVKEKYLLFLFSFSVILFFLSSPQLCI